MDDAEITLTVTIAAAAITAVLNVIAIYRGGNVETRVSDLVDGIRELNRRLDSLTSQQFQALLGYVRELTGSFSEKLVSMDQKLDRLLQRQ